LLNFRRIIGPQREVLAQLTRGEVPFIRESTRVYLRDVLDHLVRAVEMIELYRDLIVGTRDIYMSGVSNNLNRIMKALTIITVIALPLNVITGFFGMNFDDIPGLHSPLAFWITVAVMISAVTTLAIVFARKRWL
jgi:magnesium transporter